MRSRQSGYLVRCRARIFEIFDEDHDFEGPRAPKSQRNTVLTKPVVPPGQALYIPEIERWRGRAWQSFSGHAISSAQLSKRKQRSAARLELFQRQAASAAAAAAAAAAAVAAAAAAAAAAEKAAAEKAAPHVAQATWWRTHLTH